MSGSCGYRRRRTSRHFTHGPNGCRSPERGAGRAGGGGGGAEEGSLGSAIG